MLAGTTIGRYNIIEKIGSGGMGDVYLAEDPRLSRSIALKTLPPDVAGDAARMRRFVHEAKTASALNHPNIVTIYEISEEGETPYIAMEYVRGDTLGRLMKAEPFELARVLDAAGQVAGALAAAHDAGIVHRDIKPDNIIIRPDGIVKVLDFGLAKLTENDGSSDPDAETVAHRTNPGMILGTASFMSPEQARGREIDGRSDIFSFGIVLYRMIAGRLPFRGENYIDVISNVLHEEPAAFADLGLEAPPELETLIRKCLRKDREERFQTARELYADISELRRTLALDAGILRPARSGEARLNFRTNSGAGHSPTAAGSQDLATSSITRAIAEEVRYHPVRALSLLLILVFGIGGASYGVSKLWPAHTRAFESLRFIRLTTSGNVPSFVSAISPEGRLVAYVTRENGSEALWVQQAAAETPVAITAQPGGHITDVAFSPDSGKLYYSTRDGDGNSTLFQTGALGGEPRRLATNVDGDILVSPDGGRIVFSRGAATLMAMPAAGGEPAVLAAAVDGNRWTALDWAPDGTSITGAYYSPTDSANHIASVNVVTGEIMPLPGPTWVSVSGIDWRQDGSGIYLSGRDGGAERAQIWFIEYPSFEVRRVTNDLNTYVGIDASADGATLVSVQESRNTSLWEIPAEGSAAERLTATLRTEDGASGVALGPDGSIIYTTRTLSAPDLWLKQKGATGSRQLTFESRASFSPSISPDGRTVVFVSTRGGKPDIWRMDVNGENAALLAGDRGLHRSAGFTPDGKWVIYDVIDSDQNCSVWRVAAAGGTPEPVITDVDACQPTVSPDGSSLLYFTGFGRAGSPTRVMVHPLDGGSPRELNFPAITKRRMLEWSPDGKSVIYISRENNVDNLWSQPIDGGEPRRLTHFDSEWIFRFDVQHATGSILLSRGVESADAVLVEIGR